ncbi:MAG: hypothetical protein M1820_001454 [Bogoriella megaspora]|nr:MAG: hypothetical protein M1820_001454 [Bogoriella megaspora]
MAIKVAVYGATGYTGRLIAAELSKRNVHTVLLGRNELAMSELPGEHETRVVSLDNLDALTDSLKDCDVVISCVTPFTQFGEPVLKAALAAGCHYVDISGEQNWIRKVHTEYGAKAVAAGLTLLPAATDDGIMGDLIAGLVAKRLSNIKRLYVHHGYFDAAMSRGSVQSFQEFTKAAPGCWKDGAWTTEEIGPHSEVNFPGKDGKQSPELLAIQRHVSAEVIQSTVNMDLVAGISALSEDIVKAMPFGPSEQDRVASRFTILVEAESVDGRKASGYASRNDIYNTTAVVAVESALRIADGKAPKGVVAPSEAFQAEEFLRGLENSGMKLSVEV